MIILIIYTDRLGKISFEEKASKFSHDKTHTIKVLETFDSMRFYDFSDLSQSLSDYFDSNPSATASEKFSSTMLAQWSQITAW